MMLPSYASYHWVFDVRQNYYVKIAPVDSTIDRIMSRLHRLYCLLSNSHVPCDGSFVYT